VGAAITFDEDGYPVTIDRSEEPSRDPEPTGRRGPLAGYTWWVFLGTGLAALVLGAWTLITTPTPIATVAKIAGIAFVVDALPLCLLASQAQEWSGFYLLGALTAIVGVGLLVFSDGHDLFRLAVVLGAGLALRGLIDALVAWGGISDFTEKAHGWEWILLAVGLVIFAVGVAALLMKGRSTFGFAVIVGCAIFARGIGMLAISYRLRGLT
jgi:uncharacterized membrane protein HdeD (DUF308 family)